MQSIMGSPQGHCKARDETRTETENVRLPQGLCRENYYSQDRASKNYQQVCSGVDKFNTRLHLSGILPVLSHC